MHVEFRKPYTDDFIYGLKEALQYVRDSYKLQFHQGKNHTHLGQAQHCILIPIKSPGGDTALLKEILTYINTIKSDKVPVNEGNSDASQRRIKIVTYGIGQVASCAFILHQSGK